MTSAVSLRIATMTDLPELRRLRLSSVIDEVHATHEATTTCRRYVLVVDAPFGGLAAATIIALEPPWTHLEALVMDERCATAALEARLIGVAEALGAAFGCRSFEVRKQYAA